MKVDRLSIANYKGFTMNRTFIRAALALAVAGLATTATSAQAATTLRLSHFWPEVSTINKQIFAQWAKAVEEDSNGELRVQLFPSQTLSQADETYSATVNGIADIGITAQGYTNGRFPLSQIVELPGVAESAPQGACVLQTLYDDGQIAQEYDDSHVLFMFTTGPGYIHTKDTDVQKPSDLEGLRIRRPTAVAGDILENMGAQPVGMPAPDIYTSLQRGVIDGLSFPWEGINSFQLADQLNYHTQVPFYTLIFVATMNQSTYESLSPEQKQAIDRELRHEVGREGRPGVRRPGQGGQAAGRAGRRYHPGGRQPAGRSRLAGAAAERHRWLSQRSRGAWPRSGA